MHEIICSIVWLILGIIQIFLLVSSLMGICNIVYALVNGFIKIKYMLKPYEHDTYKYYKDKMPIIIISIVSNIFLGAVIGIIAGIYELYIRNYVLKNKFAFNKI